MSAQASCVSISNLAKLTLKVKLASYFIWKLHKMIYSKKFAYSKKKEQILLSILNESNLNKHICLIFVQQLRSKPWTYKSKVCFSLFVFFIHSVSNFLGIQLANAMVSGSGSDIPLIQDIEPSNSRARLSHDTLRFFSLAEQCHTQNFYLRCFKSDFDAAKSKFDLLIE